MGCINPGLVNFLLKKFLDASITPYLEFQSEAVEILRIQLPFYTQFQFWYYFIQTQLKGFQKTLPNVIWGQKNDRPHVNFWSVVQSECGTYFFDSNVKNIHCYFVENMEMVHFYIWTLPPKPDSIVIQ